jgi:hypothetical protein
MRRWLKWTLRLVALVVVLAVGLFSWFVLWPAHGIPALEPVDEYVWLDQGWGDGQNAALRRRYYYTPQGTSVPQGSSKGALRYAWFVNLELPFSTQRFADPAHMRKLRFLVDPEPSPENPHQLPIGFTKHFDPLIREDVLDITCAACHTGEIHRTVTGHSKAIRIDGGQAMHAFTDMSRGNFAPLLLSSLISTSTAPWKFDRFARNVLGADYPKGKSELAKGLRSTIHDILAAQQNNPLRGLYPVHEGFGRTDALGRIGNTVFGDHMDSSNYQDGDAPVSYPYLWNIWKFDWVQYNGSVAQPLARNVGEALGVGANTPYMDADGKPLPPQDRFRSSVDIPGLHRIEGALQMLRPPRWPEDILGGIDREKAARGEILFKERCQECHGPHVSEPGRQLATAPLKLIPGTAWRIEVIPLEHIGTDPTAAMRFMDRRYDLSPTGLTNAELADTLRPLLIRNLSRDVRFRIRELARLREGEAATGTLTTVAAAYPDPDTGAATLPEQSFSDIDAALKQVFSALPKVPAADKRPMDYLGCGESCHLRLLLWDLRHGKESIDTRLAGLDVKKLSEGVALNLVGLMVKNRYYAEHKLDYATQQCLEGYGALDLPQVIPGYKPRPLEGVWATPPFLHNGSVPTLYQMLLPPEKRDKKFFVGRREYDPVHAGYVTEPDADGDSDGFWLDTNKDGNHNSGHAFAADAATWKKYQENPKANPLPPGVIGPEFTDDERYAIIEYLKVHRDLPETPADFQPPECALPEAST